MSEESTIPTEEEMITSSEPTVFNWVAGSESGETRSTGPVELEYTPDGWVVKQ